ncbi:hypothetical protein [Ponticoccus alexandrii]|uniref:Uncharacterized protein n=1 Tax=Ponticoccus alexandrii TaxID=1943633 RepID=A0ABX7FC18_9RHOB|nr:hypothetical protein [Ponticoccus alexandrii]QRF67253.1 hypothetical protein GQA70_13610 [Ponticoccus alexandrii]
MTIADLMPLLGSIIGIALLAGFAFGLRRIGGGIFVVPTFQLLFRGLDTTFRS